MKDRSITNAFVITALVMLGALQLLIIMVYVFSFIPVPLEPFIKDLPPKLQETILPERELFFYRIFIIAAIICQGGAGYFLRHRLNNDEARESLKAFVLMQGGWILLELFAAFKMYTYQSPWWARDLFYFSIGASVLSWVFWPELRRVIFQMKEGMMQNNKMITRVLDIGMPILLLLCIWVPDAGKVLGRVFVWEQFRNWDTFIMMPALNSTAVSPLGVGFAAMTRAFIHPGSGDQYQAVFSVLMPLVIVYYVGLYALIRVWFGQALMAAAVVLAAVKVQMFHTGILPMIWISPQDTPIRHLFDLPVLFCLLMHARKKELRYLIGAACFTGLALGYVHSTGFCLLLALWGYIGLLLLSPIFRSEVAPTFSALRNIIFIGLMPLAVMMLLLLAAAAPLAHIFDPLKEAVAGMNSLPIYHCLRDRQFFAFFLGFFIPLVYAWTLMMKSAQAYTSQLKREDMFLIPLSIYGLAMYAHYAGHTATSHYYAVGVPFVMLAGFGALTLIRKLEPAKAQVACVLAAIVSLGALLTNTLFIYYPNAFNIARLDWNQEKDFYKSQFSVDQDAALIERLTAKNVKIAVVGSFEAAILMKAGRQPFFYHAPLISSHRMDNNVFAGTSLMTSDRLRTTIEQLQRQAPEYIFVEAGLVGTLSPDFQTVFPAVVALMQYVNANYEPIAQGKYLVAMRKKAQKP